MVETILTAAARVLTRHGYDDATTNRIASAAGVSIGSLYQYFPNKEAIVGALIERHDDATWEVFTKHLALAEGRPLAEVARVTIDAMFAAHLVDPKLHRVLHEQVPRVGKLARLRETNRRAHDLVAGMLAARAGDLDVADPAVAAFVIVEAVEALVDQSLNDDVAVDPSAVREETTRLVLRYLGIEKPSRKR